MTENNQQTIAKYLQAVEEDASLLEARLNDLCRYMNDFEGVVIMNDVIEKMRTLQDTIDGTKNLVQQ